jgi:hypothetical protein
MDYLRDQCAIFRKTDYECPAKKGYSYECGSFLLGALLRGMDAAGFCSPAFKAPFQGSSVRSTYAKLQKFRAVKWSSPSSSNTSHACNLVNRLDWIKTPPQEAVGPELRDFLSDPYDPSQDEEYEPSSDEEYADSDEEYDTDAEDDSDEENDSDEADSDKDDDDGGNNSDDSKTID